MSIFGGASGFTKFKSSRDIPSLEGKVILITGANSGLGKQCVIDFALHKPRAIWMAGRNLEKLRLAASDVKKRVPNANLELLELDLTSFATIAKASKTFLDKSDRLDILMLNGGIMAAKEGLTEDGYELQFGTNHMGHALLTKLLIPILDKTSKIPGSDVRVISVSSKGHSLGDKEGLHFETFKTLASHMGPYERYYQSKLANVLFARQLAKLYPQFTVASLNPGIVATSLIDNSTGTPWHLRLGVHVLLALHMVQSPEDGARNHIWTSVSKDVKSGEYYDPIGVGGVVSPQGADDKLAQKLWDWTQKELENF